MVRHLLSGFVIDRKMSDLLIAILKYFENLYRNRVVQG